jgi:hypothetical protein
MVKGPMINPICGSGSLKNSRKKRNTPYPVRNDAIRKPWGRRFLLNQSRMENKTTPSKKAS